MKNDVKIFIKEQNAWEIILTFFSLQQNQNPVMSKYTMNDFLNSLINFDSKINEDRKRILKS